MGSDTDQTSGEVGIPVRRDSGSEIVELRAPAFAAHRQVDSTVHSPYRKYHEGLEITTGACLAKRVTKAFILGAGLGNRLRPLTDRLPKPLVPLFHQPLAWWTIAACGRAGIRSLAINTHHLPDSWKRFIQRADIRKIDITLFHEPALLETGGGLKNIAAWMGDDPLLVHNGDIFSTMHLDKLIAAHEASGLPVTLALRREGVARHIAIDPSGTRVSDIRKILGIAEGSHVFSGIYCVNPGFLDLIPAGEKISIIPAFLELAKAGKLGAIVLDEGAWLDLGERDSYLDAHRDLSLAPAVHETATVESGAHVIRSIIGPGARIDAGATIRDSVVWPGGRVKADAVLDRCIVFSDNPASGVHQNEDL